MASTSYTHLFDHPCAGISYLMVAYAKVTVRKNNEHDKSKRLTLQSVNHTEEIPVINYTNPRWYTVFADLVTKKKNFPDLHLADKFVLFSFFHFFQWSPYGVFISVCTHRELCVDLPLSVIFQDCFLSFYVLPSWLSNSWLIESFHFLPSSCCCWRVIAFLDKIIFPFLKKGLCMQQVFVAVCAYVLLHTALCKPPEWFLFSSFFNHFNLKMNAIN